MQSFKLKLLIGFLFLLPFILKAQPDINLPSQFNLIVNDTELYLTCGWVDSLVVEALSAEIRFKIVGASCSDKSVITQIQLPQFLSLSQVYRQIVIYYSLIPEEDRQKDKLYIYPYFLRDENSPSLECRYNSGGEFDISVFKWEQIPIPSQPDKKQLEIFNKILQVSFHETSSFSGISEELLNKFAQSNDLPAKRVKQIYQNTILWQLSL